MSRALVRVAAAVILKRDGQVLLAQRPVGKVYAGYWEFPGGKLEPGESPRDALDRELHEELGLTVRRASSWLVRRYEYEHAHVELHFFRVLAFDGEPIGHDGQAFAWQDPRAFTVEPLLPANAPIIKALQLPWVYGITMACEVGESTFLARLQRALDAGLRLVQVREKTWPIARQEAFARRVLAISQPYGATVLLNGTVEHARAWGCHGVHLTSEALARATERPHDLMCAASCHTAAEIARAGDLQLDFAVLGPVAHTASHSNATPIGWTRFAAMISDTTIPVFALGGLVHEHLDRAIEQGAHGVALRSGAWPA
ncbi:MAG TPA: Nudix family hydrolase [Casimicrobiaceae bacterium]|nr:Nudix family hydrolase [Casimicrobiaceae bacterium]